ncbi:hypothetical protein B0A62_20030 [Flavobacterium hydatis]|uniref:Uncharacterized protein n=2 Tax=Flavobacterium hydatis TaxID=991 RepID=A0A086A083_FLAHY|nr:hypothetical protein IW20_21745 [Flavobacterium hydatis]OXA90352.1 hypothetical protein B0A62_20030 [Flavobacterium hydatis]
MKKIITLFCLSISLLSCAQKEVKKENIMSKENIQKIATIYKEVKLYDYNPSYTLHINKAGGFSYEFLINDYPVDKKYESGTRTGSFPINPALLKSGMQKVTIRMTPPVDKNFDMGKLIDPDYSELEFRITKGDYKRDKAAQHVEVFKYTMSKLKEALPYYEINLEFEAKLPYQLKGWENSVDLSKEDSKDLKLEVEKFYKEMIKTYEGKDINTLAGNYYNRTLELQQAGFENKPDDTQIIIDEWIKDLNDTRPFIFDQYKMKFYGNGKMVALVKTDKYYLNFSSLMREDANGNYTCYGLILHRPRAGGSLEVIR